MVPRMKTVAAVLLAFLAIPVVAGAAEKPRASAKSKAPAPATERTGVKDVTGNYAATGPMGNDKYDMDVAQGDNGLVVEFRGAYGITTHTCDCNMSGTPAGDAKWTLSGDAKGSLGVFGEKLIVDIERPADCCGAGFPGAPDFKLAGVTRPAACTVKAKAAIHGADGAATNRSLSKGEKVEAFVTGAEDATDLVVARTTGRKHLQGFLAAGDLECPKPMPRAATPAAPVETPATDETPAAP